MLFEDFVADQNSEANKLLSWLDLKPMDFSEVKDNPSGQAKSVALARFLFHSKHKRLRRISSFLMPRKIRQRIYGWMVNANFKPYNVSNKPRLSNEALRAMTGLFARDIQDVEQLTQIDLSRWVGGTTPYKREER